MTAPSFQARVAPAALAAFLRGVERRGAVLAELQCGDSACGDVAMAAAMAGFPAAATGMPMADWPRMFWALLLAQPRLRHRTPVAMALDATDNLADLGSGPRVALLLRLAAGLTEADAAAVLGVAAPTYSLALRRALPSHADGRADPEAWQRLREQIHRRIKTLPQDRLLRLARAREAALDGQSDGSPLTSSPPDARPRRRLLAVLWTLLALCAVAMAATFWRPGAGTWSGRDDDMRVRRQALPTAEAPASRYGRDAGLIAHRDFALLGDPMAEVRTRDLDFHSWLVSQQAMDAADRTEVVLSEATVAADASGEMDPDDAPR